MGQPAAVLANQSPAGAHPRSRLLATVLLLVAITFEGVNGELARLKLAESRWGAQLDTSQRLDAAPEQ